MGSAKATQKCVKVNASVATRSVPMNASQKDNRPMARGSVQQMAFQNVFLRDIPAMENVKIECSNVAADAILKFIKPATVIMNVMESASQK